MGARIIRRARLGALLKRLEKVSTCPSYFWQLQYHLSRHPVKRRGSVRHHEMAAFESTVAYIEAEIARRAMTEQA